MEDGERMEVPKGTGTGFVDIALIGLVVVVILMSFSPSLRPMAIGIGIVVPWAGGMIAFLAYILGAIANRDTSTGDANFSSFFPEQERAFVGHEKRMREISSRASLMGFGIAGTLFVIGLGVTLGMYTPCTNFCDHPPGSCKSDKTMADWRAGCATACARLESTPGMQMLKAKSAENTKETVMTVVSGTEYVEALSACSFSGGLGNVCEEVTKRAVTMGLWCPETNN